MITLKLTETEARDVVYGLKLAADAVIDRATCKEYGERQSAGYRVAARLSAVGRRIETAHEPVGGRCIHGIAFAVPCLQCLGKLKGE